MKLPPAVFGPGSRAFAVGVLLAGGSLSEEAKSTAPTHPPVAAAALSTVPGPKVNRPTQALVQARLQPSTPEHLIEKHGAVGSLFLRPRKVNPLQLLNPLAPAEYGGTGGSPAGWSWDPLVAPGQGARPSGFQDDRFHEASGVLFNRSFK